MYKFFCLLFLLVLTKLSFGQEFSPKLYYFVSADSSFVGVKDECGKIIIPAVFSSFFMDNEDLSQPITTALIEFYSLPQGQQFDRSKPAMPTGTVYNRKGEFLYHAQLYDNGPDYWKEGVRRYVENGKMGFVDKSGHKITPAKWDFVEPFNYGYAKVMEGDLTKVYDSSGEHWWIGSEGPIETYLINKKGERVGGYAKKQQVKDYFYEDSYYPYPFSYSEKEQQILAILEADIFGITLLFADSYYQYQYTPLQLEITERPSPFRPYYVVTPYNEDFQVGFSDAIYVDASTLETSIQHYGEMSTPLREAILQRMEDLLNNTSDTIIPETRQRVSEELKRLKSHP